jgi:hypothetical protein
VPKEREAGEVEAAGAETLSPEAQDREEVEEAAPGRC